MSNNRFALLIGVSQYGEGMNPREHESLIPLPGCLKDVIEMKKVLEDPEIGSFKEVEVVENPTSLEMLDKIESFFINKSPDDLLLFYYSGHGDLGKSIAHQSLHLCTRDTRKRVKDKSLVKASAMTAFRLNSFMNESRAKRIIAILDCCYSGYIFDMVRKGETSINYNEFASDDPKNPGRVVLAASREEAEQEEGGLSKYTACLIDGMRGRARPRLRDLDWIEAQDLHAYVLDCFAEGELQSQPQILVTKDEGYKIPVVRAPSLDPEEVYLQEVEELFEALSKENPEFDGVIQDNSYEHKQLEVTREVLGLTEEEAQDIERRARVPLIDQARHRKLYRELAEKAYERNFPLTKVERSGLDKMARKLGLDEDIASKIENKVITKLEMEVVENPTVSLIHEENQSTDANLEGADNLNWEKAKFETIQLEVKTKGVLGLNSEILMVSKPCEIKYFLESLENDIFLKMIFIQPGSFWMGASQEEESSNFDEWPCHKVEISSFCLSETQITQGQWKNVASLPKVNYDLEPYPSCFKLGDNYPVEQVTWFEAVEFCDRLSSYTDRKYRLPTESEWEYACRAGTDTPFYFGNTLSTELANYDGNSVYGKGKRGEYREQTTPVGIFPPNAFGLCDMHGNLWEWCLDHWHSSYQGAPIDGSSWLDTNMTEVVRLIRGGSWDFEAQFCRSAMRNGSHPHERKNSIGFRVTLSF